MDRMGKFQKLYRAIDSSHNKRPLKGSMQRAATACVMVSMGSGPVPAALRATLAPLQAQSVGSGTKSAAAQVLFRWVWVIATCREGDYPIGGKSLPRLLR